MAGKCPENTFTCDNGECITKTNPECDSVTDCVDGSDEAFCCKCHHLAIMLTLELAVTIFFCKFKNTFFAVSKGLN